MPSFQATKRDDRLGESFDDQPLFTGLASVGAGHPARRLWRWLKGAFYVDGDVDAEGDRERRSSGRSHLPPESGAPSRCAAAYLCRGRSSARSYGARTGGAQGIRILGNGLPSTCVFDCGGSELVPAPWSAQPRGQQCRCARNRSAAPEASGSQTGPVGRTGKLRIGGQVGLPRRTRSSRIQPRIAMNAAISHRAAPR